MHYFLLMVSGFILILAIGQLFVPNRTDKNVLLSFFLLTCFVWLSHGIGFQLGMINFYPHLNKLHVPFLALSGPTWYLYLRVLISENRLTENDRKHLLPAITSILLSIPFLMQSEEFKREYVEIELTGFVTITVFLATRIAEVATIVYLGLSIRLIGFTRGRSSILLILTIIATVAAIMRLLGSIAGNHTISVFIPIVVILPAFIALYCLSQRDPWLMALSIQKSSRIHTVTDKDKEQVSNYLEHIKINGWHLDPNFKLKNLARKEGITENELSGLINRVTGGNFKNFINELRVEHAKELLLDPKNLKIVDIWPESGFNSQSVFYSQFAKYMSMTPKMYRELHRERESDSILD